jgi:hypothetical protein
MGDQEREVEVEVERIDGSRQRSSDFLSAALRQSPVLAPALGWAAAVAAFGLALARRGAATPALVRNRTALRPPGRRRRRRGRR